MAHMSVLVVDLTFGEVYDAPQRAPPVLRSSSAAEGGRPQAGLRPEAKKDLNHRGHRGHREKKEDNCGDSFSVPSEFSVVKKTVHMPKAYLEIYATLAIRIVVLFTIGLHDRVRDRHETSWAIWGPSVPHIGSRPIERNHRRSCSSTSRISRLRSDQRWGAIGHSKVQVISCRSLKDQARGRPALSCS